MGLLLSNLLPLPPCPISQVETYGKPTWSRLVKAVEKNNRAIAQAIARDHPAVPGNLAIHIEDRL